MTGLNGTLNCTGRSAAARVSDKTLLRQNPLYNVKFRMAFNSSERNLSEYILPTQKDVINGHFVRQKQTGNKM